MKSLDRLSSIGEKGFRSPTSESYCSLPNHSPFQEDIWELNFPGVRTVRPVRITSRVSLGSSGALTAYIVSLRSKLCTEWHVSRMPIVVQRSIAHPHLQAKCQHRSLALRPTSWHSDRAPSSVIPLAGSHTVNSIKSFFVTHSSLSFLPPSSPLYLSAALLSVLPTPAFPSPKCMF